MKENVKALFQPIRIGNNEHAANFLNAACSVFELAYTI